MPLSPHAKRIATTAVLLPVLALVLWGGREWIALAAFAASTVGLLEYYRLFWRKGEGYGKKTLGIGLSLVIFGAAFLRDPLFVLVAFVLAAWAGNFFFLFSFSRRPSETFYTNVAVLVGGLLYVPLGLQFFCFFSRPEIVYILVAAVVTDTGAFYAGSQIGGPKLWPSISPKKTWAGSVGGLAACLAWSVVFGLAYGQAPLVAWLMLGLVINAAAQFGDLFESAMKRWLQVKDTGDLLPGHGGMLDRIDSLLFAAPVYAAIRAIYPFF
jgi:phosphatidate cytidylyltransferase